MRKVGEETAKLGWRGQRGQEVIGGGKGCFSYEKLESNPEDLSGLSDSSSLDGQNLCRSNRQEREQWVVFWQRQGGLCRGRGRRR